MFKNLMQPRDSLDDNWPRFHMFMVLAILAAFLPSKIVPIRFNELWQVYGYAAVAVLAALYLYHRRLGGVIEVRLMAFYTIWVFISRWLNRDFYLAADLKVVYDCVLSFLVFAAGILLKGEQRKKALDWASIILGGFAFVMAVVGLFIVLSGTSYRFSPEYRLLALSLCYPGTDQAFYALNYFFTHRNISSLWMFAGFSMMLYQFFACRKKLWRIPIVIAAILEFAAIALCHSRTVQIVISLSLGLLALLLAIRYLRIKSRLLLIPLLILVMPVTTLLSYKASEITVEIISDLSSVTVPAFTRKYQDLWQNLDPYCFTITPLEETASDGGEETGTTAGGDEAAAEQPSNTEPTDLSDHRDFGKDFSTFTGRTSIWMSAYHAAKDTPSILLRGTLGKTLMVIPQKYTFDAEHMHNFVLQVFMLTGLPGVLLVLAQCLLLVIHLLRLFFCKRPDVPMASKVLAIPVFCMFLYFMMEVSIFTAAEQRSLNFFLIAGMAMAAYYDAFPEKAA